MFIVYKPGTNTALDEKYLQEKNVNYNLFNDARFPLIKVDGVNDEMRLHLEKNTSFMKIIDGPTYVLASRLIEDNLHTFSIGNATFAEDKVVVIAGPCSVTNDDTLMPIALRCRAAGASLIRGGVFKPRTSPYVFQGIGKPGLALVDEVEKAGLPFVSEVMSEEQVDILAPHISAFQVGARNMQNFNLLKRLGKQSLPVVLKQGFGCTLVEFLNAAEYVMSGGNENVALVVRGIRSYEKATRFTLDLGAIAWLKKETRLPVIVDPSHAIGQADLIAPAAKAAIAAGADGLMLEVHSDPETSISDADQALSLDAFDDLMLDLRKIAAAVDKTIAQSPVVRLEESS